MRDNKTRDTIIEALKNTPVGLTSAELRTRLLVKALKLPEYKVTKELRILQSEGKVRMERGRWNFITTNEIMGPSYVEVQNNPQSTSDKTAISITSSSSGVTTWSPSKSKLLNEAVPSEEEADPEKKLDEFSGPWGTFRKLLNYYVDCVRNDGGYEASAYMSDIGKSFFFLRQIGAWYPKAEKRWEARIPLGPYLQDFIKRIGRLHEGDVLLLGYPFQVWASTATDELGGVFAKPIFTYKLQIDSIDPNGIQVSSEDPWPEVNLDWLNYSIKDPSQQKVFLSLCGLMDRGRGDESFGDIGRSDYLPDLQKLAGGLTYYFSDRIKEALRPSNVMSSGLPERPQNGIYNRAVLMVGARTRYTSFLLKELMKITSCSDEQLDQTALRFIFRDNNKFPIMPKEKNKENVVSLEWQKHEGAILETSLLNGEQRRAVASLVNADLTVVTGPPGTGKSQVVNAAMANASMKGLSAIFSSRNHKAIDAVIDRVELNTQRPLIIRASSKKEAFFRFGFTEAITKLLSEEYNQSVEENWKSIETRFMHLLEKRAKWGTEADKIQILRDKLGNIEQQMENTSESWTPNIILELNKAKDPFPVKAVERLEHAIKNLRSKHERANLFIKLIWRFRSFLFRKRINLIDGFLKRNCPGWQKFPSIKSYSGIRELAFQMPKLILASKYFALRVQCRPMEEELKNLHKMEDLVEKIKVISDELEEIIPEALKLDISRRIGLLPDADRESFAALSSALRSLDHPVIDKEDRVAVQSALENNSSFLLKHFPLWAVTNLAVGSRFPLVSGLFDIAIIDEACQCDIPSAIPILFRAKRVGVVGDPLQLSHVTKIKKMQDAMLRKRHNLTQVSNEQRFAYPITSLYDLFAQTNGVNPIILKDTYRSTLEIAEYSNQNFYGGSLRVLTAADRLKVPRNTKPGIHWTEVESEVKSAGPHGCFAQQEITKVVEIIKSLLIDSQFEGTVGVVTPFVQQKIRLNDLLIQEIPLELRMRSQFLVDTAHGFQGDERDVMVLSLCGGPDMPSGSRAFLMQTANLLNVAVSRARAVLHIVGNKAWASRSGIRHIERLSLPVEMFFWQRPRTRWYPHESPWEKKLFDALIEKGVKTEPQYPVLGRRLDLALVPKVKGTCIDIEVDGDRYHRNPDGSRKRDDVWRDIQLKGAGWIVMRFWVYQLREDLEGCVKKILKDWRHVCQK